jgi:hypothetical protein
MNRAKLVHVVSVKILAISMGCLRVAIVPHRSEWAIVVKGGSGFLRIFFFFLLYQPFLRNCGGSVSVDKEVVIMECERV